MAGYATPAWSNDQSPAIDDSALLDIGHGIELAEHPYGVCSTAAATAAKTVTIDYSGTLTLFTGLTVRVKFTNGNSAASPTLNVNSTGDKAIVYGTAFAAGGGWTAGAVTELTYDGTNWVMSRADAVDTTPTSESTNLITSGAVFKTYQRTCNPNLLDNWYFVGGGSQQGGGQFPINQRGNATGPSTNATYFIDRWLTTYGSAIGTWTLTSAGLKLNPASGTNIAIYQYVDDANLVGKSITASVLFSDGTLNFGTIANRENGVTQNFTAGGTIRILSGHDLRILISAEKTLVAAKLELGSTQTLCHNEGTDANPVWVLNEIPNFQQELAKCQMYFLRIGKFSSSSSAMPIGSLTTAGATNAADYVVSLPTTMRYSTPSLTYSGTITIYKADGSGSVTVSNLSLNTAYCSNISLHMTATFSPTVTKGALMGAMILSGSGYVDISCDL